MKTEYTAWAVQVLRDGEWQFLTGDEGLCDPYGVVTFRTRDEARHECSMVRPISAEITKARPCRVRVTVEEICHA
jgi:hypothetical protein